MKKNKAKQPSLAQMRMALDNARQAERQQRQIWRVLSRLIWQHGDLSSVEARVAALEAHNARGALLLTQWHIAILRQELKARAK